jgi:hypothetical protein
LPSERRPPSRAPTEPPTREEVTRTKEAKREKERGIAEEKRLKREEKGGEKEEREKKKGLFDLMFATAAKELKQEVSAAPKGEIKETAGSTVALTGSEAMSKVAQLIQRMVSEMHVGSVDGQNFASLTLSKGIDVPQAFRDSSLTLSFQQGSLTVQFDHFSTPQSEQTAIYIVENNKAQLQDMMQALAAKNIQLAELTIGQYQIALPRVETLPPPFQVTAPAAAEAEPYGEGGEGEGEAGEGEEEGP